MQQLVQPPAPNHQAKENKPFRIGIIVNATNAEDIEFYLDDFKRISQTYPTKVSLVFFGYKPDSGLLNGITCEYVPAVSIIHYYKQLHSMKIDLLFIPLINNTYNATSEDYNKYLEAAILKIPVITVDIYPYNSLIVNELNGFIYEKKEVFFTFLQKLLSDNFALIKLAGEHAFTDVTTHYNFSPENARVLSNIFQIK